MQSAAHPSSERVENHLVLLHPRLTRECRRDDQGRVVIACPAAEAADVIALSQRAGVAACVIGRTGGSDLTVEGQGTISVASLRDAHERWLPGLMAAPATEA